jgi:hypothetical protein
MLLIYDMPHMLLAMTPAPTLALTPTPNPSPGVGVPDTDPDLGPVLTCFLSRVTLSCLYRWLPPKGNTRLKLTRLPSDSTAGWGLCIMAGTLSGYTTCEAGQARGQSR